MAGSGGSSQDSHHKGQIGKQRETYCIEWVVRGSLDGLEKITLLAWKDYSRDRMSAIRRQEK